MNYNDLGHATLIEESPRLNLPPKIMLITTRIRRPGCTTRLSTSRCQFCWEEKAVSSRLAIDPAELPRMVRCAYPCRLGSKCLLPGRGMMELPMGVDGGVVLGFWRMNSEDKGVDGGR